MEALSSIELAKMALSAMPKSKQGIEYQAKNRRGRLLKWLAEAAAVS